MFFQKKFITIFENENFKVEIEDKDIIYKEGYIIVLNQYIKEEIKNPQSKIVPMLVFLKTIKILWTNNEESYFTPKNPLSLYFSAKQIISLLITEENFRRDCIIKAFVHELTHCYDYSKAFFYDYIRRKDKSLFKKGLFSFSFKTMLQYLSRSSILVFYQNIRLEGFSHYMESYYQYGELGGSDFKYNMEYGRLVNILDQKLNELNNVKNELEYLNYFSSNFEKNEEAKRVLGEHLIYTILHKSKNKISFFDLIEMPFKKIIELYEEIMINEVKLQPLITYSSGKGVLDYKRTIKEWHELRKKDKK